MYVSRELNGVGCFVMFCKPQERAISEPCGIDRGARPREAGHVEISGADGLDAGRLRTGARPVVAIPARQGVGRKASCIWLGWRTATPLF